MKISKRAQEMGASATLAMAAKAKELAAKGIDVKNFAQGEPDFDTPAFIKNAAKKALDAGLTKYPPSAGTPELRAAICRKFKKDNGLDYSENEVVVTCGAKLAIFNALQVTVDPGDEVVIPAPYWVSYPDQVKLAGGEPVIIPTSGSGGFRLTPDALSRAITPKTSAFILNSPSNPSGCAYTRDELAALAKILVEKNIAIISDEIYEKLVYGNFTHTSIAGVSPEAKSLTIVINGLSKSHAMTGWRMGYAAGPQDVISKMTTLGSQQITGIPLFIQKACIEAMTGDQTEIEKMKDEFEKRRDLMLELLLTIPGVKCAVPEGAFYLLPDMRAFIGRGKNSPADADALAEYLLSEAHIATVSGDPFGAPGHIRFSYATSRENIVEGMKRLKNTLLNFGF